VKATCRGPPISCVRALPNSALTSFLQGVCLLNMMRGLFEAQVVLDVGPRASWLTTWC
jgi:hypothetical protein